MQELENAAIRSCRLPLVNDMNTSVVMDYLISEFYLEDEDEEEIYAERTTSTKNRRLLKILSGKRGKQGLFDCLLEGLEKANQGYLANCLRRALESQNVSETRRESVPDISQKLLSFGIPNLPSEFVHRDDILKKIRDEVLKLPTSGGWILIHGMGGIGKTMLAVDSLRDTRVLQKFTTIVWHPIHKVDDEKLLSNVKILIQRLDPSSTNLHSLTVLEEAQNRFRKCLSDHSGQVLFVLDDVWRDDDLKGFNNCGGSFLVTSRNKLVLSRVGGPKEVIEIKKGLSKAQTVDVFVQMLNILPSELPSEAEEIWEACDGSPLAIVMISSLLKVRPNRWSYYLNKLRESPDQIRYRSEYQYDSLYAVMKASVEALDDDLRNRYMLMVAFPKGTFLSPSILAVVWNVETEEAEDLISDLVNLSLAFEVWSKEQNTYLYHLHDLQVSFLKREYGEKQAHNALLKAYRGRFGEWHLLPDDKYIMWNIGYHLNEAGRFEELAKLLTELRFIKAKIGQTGTWNLRNDYLRYCSHFEKYDRKEEMDSFMKFLDRNIFALTAVEEGQVIDVIELGLCEPPSTEVFRQSLDLAKKESTKPYWKWT